MGIDWSYDICNGMGREAWRQGIIGFYCRRDPIALPRGAGRNWRHPKRQDGN